jgi:hypothetical protein
MNITARFVGLIHIIAITFFTFACAPQNKRVTLDDVGPPKWVLKGGGAYSDSNGNAFYGVGSASGIKNYSLQRTAADDRARNDLAKVFEVYTKSLTKDYMASITTGDFTNTSEEQNIEVALKTVTSATLVGVNIIDHWEHPTRNELFSLARLDLEKFKNNIDKQKELGEEIKKGIKDRAEKLHEEMEVEVRKKEQQ